MYHGRVNGVYRIGFHFTVVTDHQRLVSTFNITYRSLPIRIGRVMMYLQQLDFDTVLMFSITVEDIKLETTKDDVLQNLIKIFKHGNPTSYKQDPRYKLFIIVRNELSIVDKMVVKGSQIVMPQCL